MAASMPGHDAYDMTDGLFRHCAGRDGIDGDIRRRYRQDIYGGDHQNKDDGDTSKYFTDR